jgi:hypothetical protein
MARLTLRFRAAAIVLFAFASLTVSAEDSWTKAFKTREKPNGKSLPAVIWRDPGNVSTLDILNGPGGKEHAPGSTYKFVKEDMKGSNPKFEVEDEKGVKWKIKLGNEAQSETAATRLLWAAGYFADEDYYVPELRIEGLPKLHRGSKYATADGTVRGARLERHLKQEDLGEWSWFENPFVGQKEYNGLRVIMALMNNWDLKDVNNSVHETGDELRFVATDVGATFGKTGGVFGRSRNDVSGYVKSKFIDKVTPDSVDLVFHSKTFIMMFLSPRSYTMRSRMEKLAKHLPRTDARWIGQRLALLSPDQIRDCFRAAGYSPEVVEQYAKAVQKRIAELNAL